MASTNKTPNMGLPQYVGTDVPTWLGDYNDSMAKIDTELTKTNNVATQALVNAPLVDTFTISSQGVEVRVNGAWTPVSKYNKYGFGEYTLDPSIRAPFGDIEFKTADVPVTVTGVRIAVPDKNYPNGIVLPVRVACLAIRYNGLSMYDIMPFYYTNVDSDNAHVYFVDEHGNVDMNIQMEAGETLKIAFMGIPILGKEA